MAHSREQTLRQTSIKATKTRLAPVVSLFFLAPLIGEFLLGNLPITWVWTLLTLAPLYGGGALLIRETTRRLKLGWPSMIAFGLAYAIIEEAFVTQSLFNPGYLDLDLLDYGYISQLGIGIWWTVFVLSLHTIWSIAVPIALVESLTPDARHTPWLGPVGLAAATMLFLLGCALSFVFQQQEDSFMASTRQLITSAAAVVAVIGAALALGRAKISAHAQQTPAPRWVGLVAFGLSSAFMALAIVHDAIPASLNLSTMLVLLVTGSCLLWYGYARRGWSEQHHLAIAGALLLTYAWYGFVQVPSMDDIDPLLDGIGNAVFAAGALLLLVLARKRVGRTSTV